MQVQDVNMTEFVDIFATPGKQDTQSTTKIPSFKMNDDFQSIFPDKKEEVKVEEQKTTEEEKVKEDVDLFAASAEVKTKDQNLDISSYYQERLKSGKFIEVTEENDKGESVPFIPKNFDELDEVLELQVNHKFEEKIKDVDKNWYESKSPAWQLVSKYAEMVDDPSQLIPVLQGVSNIRNIAEIDETSIEGAEKIVRTKLEKTSNDTDFINTQIEALKTTNKLLDTAKSWKIPLLQEEQKEVALEMQRKEKERNEYLGMIQNIHENTIKAIESPIFGKHKLKTEEKAQIYDLIGSPSKESGGYKIFSMIDELFEKKDFEKLTKIALFLSKEESFFNYFGINVANATAEGLQRKIKLADTTKAGNNEILGNENRSYAPVTRKRSMPKFGQFT